MPAASPRLAPDRACCHYGSEGRLGRRLQRRAARRNGRAIDAFVTVDKNHPAQQQVSALTFGVIVLRAPSNRLEALEPLAPQIMAALNTLQPGQVVVISARHQNAGAGRPH
jgi:hypothetical protein